MASLLIIISLTFLGYMSIGLPLAVLPGHVALTLDFGVIWAGIAISTQYIATVISRAQSGRLTDRLGPKKAVLLGFVGHLLGGALTLLSLLAVSVPWASLALLLLGRLALGVGESWVSTGAITWAVGLAGPRDTVRIISWNGIASYGGVAVGAPVGAVLADSLGFGAIGLLTIGLAALGLVLSLARAGVPVSGIRGLASRQVFASIAPYGIALALAACGFGVVLSFIALFFQGKGWGGASYALSALGAGFILVRLVLARVVARFGGLRVARAFLLVELLGLGLVILAGNPATAMLGAMLIGIGFGPLFPALGGEAMNSTPPENRGIALGFYSAFLDVALCVAGPVAGVMAAWLGHGAPFLLGVVTGVMSLILCLTLREGKAGRF